MVGAARPGAVVQATASGFRAGESVSVTVGDLAAVEVLADTAGVVSLPVAVPPGVTG